METLTNEIQICSSKEKDDVQRAIKLENENHELRENNRIARREIDTKKVNLKIW